MLSYNEPRLTLIEYWKKFCPGLLDSSGPVMSPSRSRNTWRAHEDRNLKLKSLREELTQWILIHQPTYPLTEEDIRFILSQKATKPFNGPIMEFLVSMLATRQPNLLPLLKNLSHPMDLPCVLQYLRIYQANNPSLHEMMSVFEELDNFSLAVKQGLLKQGLRNGFVPLVLYFSTQPSLWKNLIVYNFKKVNLKVHPIFDQHPEIHELLSTI